MFTSKSTTLKLQERSTKITDVFTKTVNDLSAVNAEANLQMKANSEAIAALQMENDDIEGIAKKNARLIDKISAFVEGD